MADASASGNGSSSSANLLEDDQFFAKLDRASNTIRAFSQEDARWGDLNDHLSAAQYQYKLQLISPWAPLERKRVWSIPDAVIEASSSAQTYASQGLFPEIERAWIIIDTRLYLWNYLDASQSAFESYEHPERVIQSVGLVQPRAGVFIESIKHVLVICTSTSVSLLGLAIEDAPANSTSSNGNAASSSTTTNPTNASATPSTSAGARNPSTGKQLKLFVTEMSASTDGVQLSDVCGTDEGRIFCKGNDGCLYEVMYQASEGWFSNRCGLRNVTNPRLSNLVPNFIQGKQKETLDFISVDSARNVVYTLHKGSEIEIQHLPSKDSSKPPVKVARAKDICRHANMMCPNTSLLQPNEFLITWMKPISAAESRNIHLVAVTSKGVRLYFTNQRTGWRALSTYSSMNSNSSDPNAPTCLELIYVRPPPPAGQTQSVEGGMALMQSQQQQHHSQQQSSSPSSTTSFAPHQPAIQGLHHAYYADGLFLAASQYTLEPTGSMDCILCTTRAIPSGDFIRPSGGIPSSSSLTAPAGSAIGAADLADTATDILVQGATWAIAEVKRKSHSTAEERLHPLALQMIQPPRVFLVLTSSGLFVLTEQRPIDTLKGLLQTGTLYDQTVHEFFKKYGQSQSCAMSLAIASQNTLLSLAPETFISSDLPTQDGSYQLLSKDVVSHAWRIFFDFGGYPRYEPPPYPSQPASDGKVTLSGRHDGLAIYLTRLLRPFWTQKITKKQVIPGEGERFVPNIPASDLTGPQRELQGLQTFLQQNAQLFGLGNSSGGSLGQNRSSLNRSTGTSPEGEQVAMQAENDSFEALKALLSRSLEALSFVLLLIDYRLPNLVQRCQPELQTQLANLTFADLIITRQGRNIGRSLVEAVINMQISSQSNIDVIADVLQERCGSFCNSDDVRLYKAMECIRRAKEAEKSMDANGKSESLRESLRLLNRATSNLPLNKLESICEDFRSLKFYHGAVELPLKCASSWDRTGIAKQYRDEGLPENDVRSKAYDTSMKCYALVLKALESVDAAYQSDAVVKAREAGQTNVVLQVEEQRASTYAEAQSSTDPLFHVAMYDWLLSRSKTDELLQIRSPYVEEYLRAEPITLERCLLLCMWYVSIGHSLSAAQLYSGLAQSTELEINLDERVEYLTKASSNAKSAQQNNSQDLIQFISDIDEKLEVASVQIEIYKAIQESLEIEDEQKANLLNVLNDGLLDITALYRDFAEPLSMHEIKLLIYHVADYRDAELARDAWEALLAEAHNDALALPDTRHEKVASVVIELGHRFYPSDVAFPVDILTEMLERYAYEQSIENSQSCIPLAWSARTMLMANVPPLLVFEVLLGLFDAKREPFQIDSAQLFILADIAELARIWVEEILGTAQPSLGLKDPLLNFSARRFDDALNALLLALSHLDANSSSLPANLESRNADKVSSSLKWTQELLRRSF